MDPGNKLIQDLTLQQKEELLSYLSSFISGNKKGKFDEYIQHRTRYVTIVLEDIFQPHNASAVLRTCDCFGIQDIHIIENHNRYTLNPDVALGASKWVNLIKYNRESHNTSICLKKLKDQGYTIAAMTPHHNDILLDDFILDRKTALVFGTELEGLSDTAIAHAETFIKIPMYGFTESLNISVSAAITLFHLRGLLRNSQLPWQLTREEVIETKLTWARSIVKKADLLIQAYLNK